MSCEPTRTTSRSSSSSSPATKATATRKVRSDGRRGQGGVPQVLHHPDVVGHGDRRLPVRRCSRGRVRTVGPRLENAGPRRPGRPTVPRPGQPDHGRDRLHRRAEHRVPAHPHRRGHVDRVRVMVAKVTSLLGIGVFYGLVFLAGSVGVGGITIAIKGYSPLPAVGTITRALALSLLILGLWSLIGLGAGILIPNQVAAILIAVGAAWIVLPLVAVLLGLVSWGKSIVPYLPSEATSAMVGQINTSSDVVLVSWWAGALVLVAYAAVLAGIGSLLTVRRDVT